MSKKKILIMGLPGSGKTTLARELAPMLGAVLFNADEVRGNINKDLGFALADRIEHARRMGWLCDRVAEAGGVAIADFVCPTPETREAFGDAFVIWLDRIEAGRFADTNRLFVAPGSFDLRVSPEGPARRWAKRAHAAYLAQAGVETGAIARRPAMSVLLKAVAVVAIAVMLRSLVDAAPFSYLTALLQSSLFLAAFATGGILAALGFLLATLGANFFLIDPVFQLGVDNWRETIELAATGALAAAMAAAVSRYFRRRVRLVQR